MSDKTGPVADFPELTESKIATLENGFRARRESLLAVDEAVERLTTALGRTGQLDNTVILFTSDNGFMQGQHRWTTKVLPYEEGIRVPLVVRGPGFPAGQTSPALASNVDLPATLLKATGVAPRRPQEGVALQELLSGKDSYANRAVLLERGEATDRIVRIPTYTGVRTTQYLRRGACQAGRADAASQLVRRFGLRRERPAVVWPSLLGCDKPSVG